MHEVIQVSDLRRAKALLNPTRVAILGLLDETRTCADLAGRLRTTPQRVNHHVRRLLSAGLVSRAGTRRKRNFVETSYRRTAKAVWFSPALARPSGAAARDPGERESLHNLLRISERLQDDAAALLGREGGEEVPSVGVTAEVVLRSPGEREAFARDYLVLMHGLLEKYQAGGAPVAGEEARDERRYTAMLVCYPKEG